MNQGGKEVWNGGRLTSSADVKKAWNFVASPQYLFNIMALV
jgi:hypothetical protein